LSESINPWVYSLQFLFKSTNNSWRYERKCEWVFFSEHSVVAKRLCVNNYSYEVVTRVLWLFYFSRAVLEFECVLCDNIYCMLSFILSTVLTVTLMLQCCVRLSVVCDKCIVAKWCVLEPKLLLTACRKSYVSNWLLQKWMTLTFFRGWLRSCHPLRHICHWIFRK